MPTRPIAPSPSPLTPSVRGAIAPVKPAEVSRGGRSDRFEPLRNAIAISAGPTAEAAAPALLRAMFTAANRLEGGASAEKTAVEAAKLVLASPEMLAAFKHALPALEAAATVANPAVGNVAKAVLPLVANGDTVKALLKLGFEAAGPQGRRLVGAALRGLNNGGMAMAAAEIAATAAKIGMKSGAAGGALATVAKGLGKAAPIVGNALNILTVGSSLVNLVKSLFDKDASAGLKLAHVLHLAATVAGCFIPPVGIAGDVALAAVKAGEAR